METRTYAETKGQRPTDWYHFLQQETPTQQEWDDASLLALNWVTCACGIQCAALPRDAFGTPLDHVQRGLGLEFCGQISRQEAPAALRTLAKIEARSAHLLAQL